nr:aminopeptidase [Oceanococcus sp. HetDA_MAG_MS8]
MSRISPILRNFSLLALLLLLSGCETLAYHAQAVQGHWQIMRARVPLQEWAAAPERAVDETSKVETLLQARRYASTELALPDNRSYTQVAVLDREATVYNVVAAPEFSLSPLSWCFPVAGCINYRGYFHQEQAEKKALELVGDGYDVVVQPVAAYSTLGWFNDPIPSPVMDWPIDDIVRLIFHELAHQKLYVADATRFNESYASAVAELGLAQWRHHLGSPASAPAVNRSAQVYALLQPTLDALRELYARSYSPERMREEKYALLRSAQARYSQGASLGRYWDAWFSELNNARLAGLSDYQSRVPSFEQIFAECQQDWDCFHRRSRAIGEDPARRQQFLAQHRPALAAPIVMSYLHPAQRLLSRNQHE